MRIPDVDAPYALPNGDDAYAFSASADAMQSASTAIAPGTTERRDLNRSALLPTRAPLGLLLTDSTELPA